MLDDLFAYFGDLQFCEFDVGGEDELLVDLALFEYYRDDAAEMAHGLPLYLLIFIGAEGDPKTSEEVPLIR